MVEVEQNWFSPEQPASNQIRIQVVTSSETWAARVHIWQPPTDLYETRDAYVVQVEIAGMQRGEFMVSLEGTTLLVRGVRMVKSDALAYYQMEIASGEFITSVSLPGDVNLDQIQADYEDGFLRILLPKIETSTGRRGS